MAQKKKPAKPEPIQTPPDAPAPGKSDGGKHTTPRQTVNFPADWIELAQSRASTGRLPTPVMWYLVRLVADEAVAGGVDPKDLPPFPWDAQRRRAQ